MNYESGRYTGGSRYIVRPSHVKSLGEKVFPGTEVYEMNLSHDQLQRLEERKAKESVRRLQSAVETFFKDSYCSSHPDGLDDGDSEPQSTIDTQAAKELVEKISQSVESIYSVPRDMMRVYEGVKTADSSFKELESLYLPNRESLKTRWRSELDSKMRDFGERLRLTAKSARSEMHKQWPSSQMWATQVDPLEAFRIQTGMTATSSSTDKA